MKQLLAYCLSIILCVSFTGCMENYLDLYPEDKITSASFPENESDIKLLLNGVYAQLREKEVYNQGLFGFGITDGATPNAFNWGTDEVFNKLGAGRLSSSDGGVVSITAIQLSPLPIGPDSQEPSATIKKRSSLTPGCIP